MLLVRRINFQILGVKELNDEWKTVSTLSFELVYSPKSNLFHFAV